MFLFLCLPLTFCVSEQLGSLGCYQGQCIAHAEHDASLVFGKLQCSHSLEQGLKFGRQKLLNRDMPAAVVEKIFLNQANL